MYGYMLSHRGITLFDFSSMNNNLLHSLAIHGIVSVSNCRMGIPKGMTIGSKSGVITPVLKDETIMLPSVTFVSPSQVDVYRNDFNKTLYS